MDTTISILAGLAVALATKVETPKGVMGETVVSEISCYCCKCGEELTDAVSKDVGIGPICRKMANEVLALYKPANVEAARAKLATVSAHEIPAAAAETLAKVVATVMAGTETDWRETVKRVEWVLSRSVWGSTKDKLCDVIRALGYPTLANLLVGAAVSGKAKVTIEGGRIVLVAPNKASARAAIKAIPGRSYHPKGTLKAEDACWSVPVGEVKKLWETLVEYYPNHDTNLVKLLAECARAGRELAKNAPAAAPKVAPSVTIAEGSYGGIEIASPYNAEYVSAIKGLPYNDRKWVASKKVWWVSKEYKAAALAIVEKVYGAGAVAA